MNELWIFVEATYVLLKLQQEPFAFVPLCGVVLVLLLQWCDVVGF
jgi:hypothetical protein